MNFTHNMESPNNTERTLEYVNRNRSGNKVYLQGLIAVAIFLISVLVAVFLYIPQINQTTEVVKKRKDLETEVSSYQKKLDTITAYDQSALVDDLESAAYFIPDEIRVAQLATFINVNAKQYNLEVSRLGINEDRSEVKQSLGDEEKSKLLGNVAYVSSVFLGRVEGPFSFRGSRDDIYKFLDFLVMGGFATNFDQVSITSGTTEKDWSVTFFTSYYYLEPVKNVPPSAPLLEVQKDALKPITVDRETIAPTPLDTPTGSVTPTVSP